MILDEKRVLVLPGSEWQVELVNKIHKMGHKVFVVNPYENSPCFEYADGFLQADIFNIKCILDFCTKNGINAVISDECDIAVPLVAEISETFGLKSIGRRLSKLYTDKYLMREFCKKHGLKYPEYILCENINDAIMFFHQIKRPLVLKPINSNASKGVFKINTEEDIRRYFNKSMSFSRGGNFVLAERYIEGTEFTIDGIKTPSTHYTLAISEKKHFRHNTNIASDLFFSHYNSKYDYEALKKINDDFVINSGLEYGFTHAEYKYENGDYYLIEIAARGGGNMISSVITQYMSGYDTYEYLINCALGNVQNQDFSIKNEYMNRVAVLKFFKTPYDGGKVKKICGCDVLKNEPDIVKYKLNFQVGDVVENAISDSVRIGFYIICSESVQKLQEVIDKVENNFNIVLEEY